MRDIENTSETVKRNPAAMLNEMLIRGPEGGAIEAQEERGSRQFVKSDVLPSDMTIEAHTALVAAGCEFVGPVDGDDLFNYWKLAEGWTKTGTDHSMHNNLLDEQGRERASIFYKAAFYDRKASLSILRRYTTRRDYDREDAIVYQLLDGGAAIHTFAPVASVRGDDDYYEKDREAGEAALVYLAEHYPDNKDANAYWDA